MEQYRDRGTGNACNASVLLLAWPTASSAIQLHWNSKGDSPADSTAHQVTARFCSEGSAATIAYFLLDQPGGSQGRIKVVALNPADLPP